MHNNICQMAKGVSKLQAQFKSLCADNGFTSVAFSVHIGTTMSPEQLLAMVAGLPTDRNFTFGVPHVHDYLDMYAVFLPLKGPGHNSCISATSKGGKQND